jgi:hypothetical protein
VLPTLPVVVGLPISVPCLTPPCGSSSGAGAGVGAATSSPSVASDGTAGGTSAGSSGDSQSGSAVSTSPSPSSSTPLAQAGAARDGTAVVVVEGVTALPSETGSAPARAAAMAVIAMKPASAAKMVANLVLMPRRICVSLPAPVSPPRAVTGWRLPTSPNVHNGCGRSQQVLNQQVPHIHAGRFSAEPDALVKLLGT